MSHRVTFVIEQHDDESFGALSPGYCGFARASTDYAFHQAAVTPERYTLGQMPLDMIQWLNTHPALRGGNRLGFDQTRTGDLTFTRCLWVEFDHAKDALLFKLTWGCTSGEA
jgi:hypothetical protein